MIKRTIKNFHDTFGEVLAYIVPLLAPLPSAIAIWHATGQIVIAIVIELLGFASIAIALRTYRHNKEYDEAKRFPLWIPVAMFVIYLVATFLIIVTSETLPAWAAWSNGQIPAWEFMAAFAPMLYPALAITGAGVYALTEQLDAVERDRRTVEAQEGAAVQMETDLELEARRKRMELELEEERKDREAKREERRLKVEAKLSHSVLPGRDNGTPTSGETVGRDEKMGRIETTIETNPFASLAQISKETGIPRSTAGRLLKGAGYHKNGNGWER